MKVHPLLGKSIIVLFFGDDTFFTFEETATCELKNEGKSVCGGGYILHWHLFTFTL